MFITGAVILVLALLLGLGLIAFGSFSGKRAGRFIAGCAVLAIVLFTLGMSTNTVSARAVGIETANGRYVSTLENGFHMKRPWAHVAEFPTSIQYLDFAQDVDKDSKDKSDNETVVNAMPASFNGGGSGSIAVTIRWRIDPANANELWTAYRDFANVSKQVVQGDSQQIIRDQFSPLTPLQAKDAGQQLKVSNSVVAVLNTKFAQYGIVVDSVSVKNVDLAPEVQQSVDAIVQAAAGVDQERQNQDKAKIQAETAKIQAKEGSLTPGALQRKCYDITAAWNYNVMGPMPATWNCSSTEGAKQVIVDTTPAKQ